MKFSGSLSCGKKDDAFVVLESVVGEISRREKTGTFSTQSPIRVVPGSYFLTLRDGRTVTIEVLDVKAAQPGKYSFRLTGDIG